MREMLLGALIIGGREMRRDNRKEREWGDRKKREGREG